ncbi:hypothetical protein D3C77_261640 [compost metagenome]
MLLQEIDASPYFFIGINTRLYAKKPDNFRLQAHSFIPLPCPDKKNAPPIPVNRYAGRFIR